MTTKLERISELSKQHPEMKFNSIGHLINIEMLKECHYKMDGRKAVGIDGISKEEYNSNLDNNLKQLVEKLKNKSYRPKPARKVEIPKENGKTRPLSIYSYEDKLVQEALRKVLESVFEPHFYSNMCGFRPNRNCHGAIRKLNDMIEGHKTNYILDADIKGFFDFCIVFFVFTIFISSLRLSYCVYSSNLYLLIFLQIRKKSFAAFYYISISRFKIPRIPRISNISGII